VREDWEASVKVMLRILLVQWNNPDGEVHMHIAWVRSV
jgi:hypothetical protein